MKNYVYKIKSKYKKHPELLEKYGFIPYQAEGEEEIIYAVGIVLGTETSIFQYLKKAFEKIYSKANEQEKEEFKEYSFTKDGRLKLTKKVKDEMSKCQLCFANSNLGEWTLFINAPDRVEYYNTKVLEECVPDLIETLRKDKVIYKSKVKNKK